MKPNILRRAMHTISFILLEGDVLYTVLPIIVYAIVRLIYQNPFNDFLGLAEWSFASIVFFGLSIRRTTQLRRAFESSLSYMLSIRIQIFVFLLVGSVLALAFTIANEDVVTVNHKIIVGIQQGFFWLGMVCLTYTLFTERKLPEIHDKNSYVLRLGDMLTTTDEMLYRFLDLVLSDYPFFKKKSEQTNAGHHEKANDELKILLQRTENSIRILTEAKEKLSNKLSESDALPKTVPQGNRV
jgi:hypothetical protein